MDRFLKNVLAKDELGFIMLSRSALWQIGLKETIFLSELAYKFDYWKSKRRLTKDGYFFISRSDIEIETSLSKSQQTSICKTLMQSGLICMKKKKYDGCNYYKLNCKRICEMLDFKYDDKKTMSSYFANDKNGYVIVCKTIISKLGLYEAILLGEVISKYEFWLRKDKLEEAFEDDDYYDGCFYMSRKDLEKETGLSKFQQIKTAKRLAQLHLLNYSKLGMDGCNYYWYYEDDVMMLLDLL